MNSYLFSTRKEFNQLMCLLFFSFSPWHCLQESFLCLLKWLALNFAKDHKKRSCVCDDIFFSSRSRSPRCNHLQPQIPVVLAVTSPCKRQAPQSAPGAGPKMTARIAFHGSCPKLCVLIVLITAVQCYIITGDWCRDVTSQQDKLSGNGL